MAYIKKYIRFDLNRLIQKFLNLFILNCAVSIVHHIKLKKKIKRIKTT